jgi:hypothetical protein
MSPGPSWAVVIASLLWWLRPALDQPVRLRAPSAVHLLRSVDQPDRVDPTDDKLLSDVLVSPDGKAADFFTTDASLGTAALFRVPTIGTDGTNTGLPPIDSWPSGLGGQPIIVGWQTVNGKRLP